MKASYRAIVVTDIIRWPRCSKPFITLYISKETQSSKHKAERFRTQVWKISLSLQSFVIFNLHPLHEHLRSFIICPQLSLGNMHRCWNPNHVFFAVDPKKKFRAPQLKKIAWLQVKNSNANIVLMSSADIIINFILCIILTQICILNHTLSVFLLLCFNCWLRSEQHYHNEMSITTSLNVKHEQKQYICLKHIVQGSFQWPQALSDKLWWT